MSRKFTTRGANKVLSENGLEILKENARGILSNARRSLLDSYPFIGSVAMTLDIVPVRDIRLSTAATDGQKIYFDIDFLSGLTEKQTVFVMAHEIFHCILMHIFRGGEYENKIAANLAMDMEVNQLLKNDGMSVLPTAVLPNAYKLPENLNMERYYAMLVDKVDMNKSKDNNGKGQNSNGAGGSGAGGSNGQGDNGSQSGQGKNKSQNGQAGSDDDYSGNSSEQQFDKHIYKKDGQKAGGVKNADECSTGPNENGEAMVDRYGRVGIDKDFEPNVKESTKEKIREACVSAAQMCERTRGTVPAYAKQLVNEMLEPQICWKEVLANFINKVSGIKNTWNRPNRRFSWQGTYLPGHEDNQLKVAIVLDTSGSTAGDIPQFLGEVNSISKMANEYEITIVDCDAKVNKVRKFSQDNPLDLENEKFDVYGGGGTELLPAFKQLSDDNIDADVIIAFTDGYCEDIGPNDIDTNIPVLWVISSDNKAENITVGEKTWFKY